MNDKAMLAMVVGLLIVVGAAIGLLLLDTDDKNAWINKCSKADGFVDIKAVGWYGPTEYECVDMRGEVVEL